jgi:urease accessory protein
MVVRAAEEEPSPQPSPSARERGHEAALGRRGSPVPRATNVVASGTPSDTATLAHDDRHRRRLRLATDSGAPFLLDLPEARLLRDGDLLALDDGRLVLVRAAPEPVLEVAAEGPTALARLAWHLGNRHTPVEVLADGRLRLRADHVLAAMLEGLGARVTATTAPFTPESGAYGHGHG